jgi:hypothetical protein
MQLIKDFVFSISSMNPFMKLTKADFTLVDPQIRTGKGVKFSDVAGLRVCRIVLIHESKIILRHETGWYREYSYIF